MMWRWGGVEVMWNVVVPAGGWRWEGDGGAGGDAGDGIGGHAMHEEDFPWGRVAAEA